MAEASSHEEDVVGKAYDSRLMKRLLTYLSPYYGRVLLALAAIFLKSGADVMGPFLTALAIDKYLAPAVGAQAALKHHGFQIQLPVFLETFINRWLSPRPLTGIAQIAAVYVGLL